MDVQFWAATDVGKARDHNEDNFLVDKRLNLFIVCDGMGGHAAGEVASAVAVRAIREVVANNRDIFERCTAQPDNIKARKDLLRVLEYAIQEACTRIYDLAQENAEQRGMGTTCSMMVVSGRRCFIAHVGDSRIYLYRKGQVHQLTEDHTLVNEMLRRGRIQNASSVEAKYKNAITRAVGVYESVEVDTLDFDTLPGDRFMLCSDGLSGYLDHDGIARFVGPEDARIPATQEEFKKISSNLIGFANDCGGKDNITVVMVGLSEESENIETEEVNLTMETIRNIPLFHYLSYKELVRIVNVTQKVTASAGDEIIREGEDGEELFIITRGTYAVEKKGQEVTRLGSGRHFGEMALIDDGPRSATVKALTSGTLLTIDRGAFYELLRKDPTLAVKLLWNFIQTLSVRLRDVPVPDEKVRRFIEEATGSAKVPPANTTQEIDLAHAEEITASSRPPRPARPMGKAPPLESLDDEDEELINEIERVQSITGEEITLPGVKVEDLPSRKPKLAPGNKIQDTESPRRHRPGQQISPVITSSDVGGADTLPPGDKVEDNSEASQ